jgi:PAS domain S-box-containing protein
MNRSLSLTPKVTLVFVLFAALLLMGVGLAAYESGRAALEAATMSDLLSTALEKEAALETWLRERQVNIAALARSPEIVRNAELLLDESANSEVAQAAHDDLLSDFMTWTGEEQVYSSLSLLHADTGRVQVASDPSEEGKFREHQPYFIFGRERPYLQNVYYSLQVQGPAIATSAPLRSPDGRLIGVLVGRLRLNEMNEIISRRTGLHTTLDAYLVNRSNLFVTQPRAISDPAVLNYGIYSNSVKQCLTGESGSTFDMNYQGDPSISVYRWLPERQLCLIVEMDEAEAFQPVQAFGAGLAGVSILVLGVASLTAFRLARTITRPVRALQAGAIRFGQGELETRLPETSSDELGVLAHEFNAMAAKLADKERQLRGYTTELEQKVQERTAALQASEAELRALFASMTDAIVVMDDKGRYLKVAPTNPTPLYQAVEGVIGKRLHDLFPDEQADTFLGYVTTALNTQQTVSAEYSLSIGGRDVWFTSSITPMSDDAVIWIARDITERKTAEQQLQQRFAQLQAIYELNDAVTRAEALEQVYALAIAGLVDKLGANRASLLLFDPDDVMRFKAWRGLSDTYRRTTEGHSPWGRDAENPQPVLVPDIEQEPSLAGLRDIVVGEGICALGFIPLIYEGRLLGKFMIYYNTAHEFSPVEIQFAQTIASHIAFAIEHKRVEQMRLDLLEREHAARLAAEKADALKLQFLAMISHELRTPLTSIKGFSSTLLAEDVSFDARSQREFISIVDAEADKLTDLVEQLIDISRLQAGNLRINRARRPFTDIINVARAQIQALTRDHQLVLDIPQTLPEVLADDQRLAQVLVNLVENAAKYSPSPSLISVCAREEGTVIRVDICDEGEGIPMEERSAIFEAFRQVNKGLQQRGAGLGLAICKGLVEAHGGQIWVQDHHGPGTIISFTVPVA